VTENPGVTDLQRTRLRHLADRLAQAANDLPRWRLRHNLHDGYLADRPGWDTRPQAVLHVDRGRASGLVHVGQMHGPGWWACYHRTRHDFWDDVRDATSHDDSVRAHLARQHESGPTCHELDVKNPVTTLRAIEAIRDREIDSWEQARRLADRLNSSFEETLAHPGEPWDTGDALDLPRDAYVQWTRVSDPGSPLHVEVTDGSDYYEPMPAHLRELFVDLGWNPPDDTFRNPWMWAETPEELQDTARLVVRTLVSAFGLQDHHLRWERLRG
jgi:hypothetical protein